MYVYQIHINIIKNMTTVTRNLIIAIVAAVIITTIIILISIYAAGLFDDDNSNALSPVNPDDILDQLLLFVTSNIVITGNINTPLSYNVLPEYFDNLPDYSHEALSTASDDERYDLIVAKYNQTNGINIYDSALYVTCVSRFLDTTQLYNNAIKWLTYLAVGESYPLAPVSELLISPKPSNLYKYRNTGQDWPSSTVGTMGYAFRGLPTRGYSTAVEPYMCSVKNTLGNPSATAADVFINPTVYSGCTIQDPNFTQTDELYLFWSDFRPVTGENAWVLMSICHMMNSSMYSAIVHDVLPSFTTRLVNTISALEMGSNSGAVFYSPQLYTDNTYTVLADPGWDTMQFSTENLCSTAAALYATSISNTVDSVVRDNASALAQRIAHFVTEKCVKLDTYTYSDNKGGDVVVPGPSICQGGRATTIDSEPDADGTKFAVDCFSWAIIVFGNFFEARQSGLCMALYQTLRKYAGIFSADGTLNGFGYSIADTVISGEWTLGVIAALNVIRQIISPNNISDIINDVKSMNEYLESEMYTSDGGVTCAGKAVYYANMDYNIPFGWIARKNASLASTAWQIANLKNFNLFSIQGDMKFVMPVL